MLAPLWAVGMVASFLVGGSAPAGYLLVRARGQVHAVPYLPREGDLVFYDDHSKVWTTLFAFAGTGPPLHMGIVVKKPGGALAVLEAGPDDRVWVELLDLAPRLRQFHRDFRGGNITIRRCKVALSRERSAALTRFALKQKGKPYAVLELLAQGTPFRVRGLMEPLLAKTDLDKDAWICSELAVAAGTVARLFDPRVVRSNATYPRDLVNNKRYRLSAVWEDPAEWTPDGKKEAATAARRGR